ncbi:unnamed protein product [Prunus armeniaca]
MTHILDSYCAASGQLVNLDKSNMFFSPNTPSNIKRSVCSVLNIKEADNPGKYLGLPSVWGRSKKEALGYIKERILKFIHGWNNKELSPAGKEVLIKAVATAILAYSMTRKVHWKKWAELGEAKSCGGLGFLDLALWVRILKMVLDGKFWEAMIRVAEPLGRGIAY